MEKYKSLTCYLNIPKHCSYGKYAEVDGKRLFEYSEAVKGFIRAVKALEFDYVKEYENIPEEVPYGADAPAEYVLAAICAVVYSEDYEDGKGMIKARLEDGTITRLLALLKKADEKAE